MINNKFVQHLFDYNDKIFSKYDCDDDKGLYYLDKINKQIIINKIFSAHEVAHMIEMNSLQRCLLPEWGFKMFNVDNEAPNYTNREFFAALIREIRVRAIQLHFDDYPNKYISNSTCFNILNNSFWKDGAIKFLPFGRFKSYKDISDYVGNLRDKTYSKWDLGSIECEWKRKIDYISNYLESENVRYAA